MQNTLVLYEPKIEQVISDIERDLLFQIILNLKQGKIFMNHAKSLAKAYLSLLPVESFEEIVKKLFTLIERYPEVLEVYIKYATQYYEQITASEIEKNKEEINKLKKGGN